jgi:hypothetical protein
VRFNLLDVHPIGLRVLLVNTREGWRLSDGHRFTKPYRDFEEALADSDTKRRLNFGEELKNQETN